MSVTGSALPPYLLTFVNICRLGRYIPQEEALTCGVSLQVTYKWKRHQRENIENATGYTKEELLKRGNKGTKAFLASMTEKSVISDNG